MLFLRGSLSLINDIVDNLTVFFSHGNIRGSGYGEDNKLDEWDREDSTSPGRPR